MSQLIEQHIAAEIACDIPGAVAVYAPDVVHDTVGSPTGALHGPDGARVFYEFPMANVTTETMEPISARYGTDFCVAEHLATVTVPGEFLGVPGNGKRMLFRLPHVWDFKDGLISRENIWLDGASIVAQLTC